MNQDNVHEKTSRRGIFKWLGKAAAGASAAAIGLSVAMPLTAQASATKANHLKVGTLLDKAGNVLVPNCLVCDGCTVISCTASGTCRGHDPNNAILVTYVQYSGCYANGACPSNQYLICTDSCTC